MITQSCDADIADWCLEFDERVSSVVWVGRAGFTASTEVGIVADSALVSVSLNIGLNTVARVAKRTITIDAVMTGLADKRSGQRSWIAEGLVDGYESVAGMDEASIGDASCAEVPIRAVKAFMTNAVDILVTSITNSIMASVAAWSKEGLSNKVEGCILNSRFECVLGVVAVLHADVARNAKVIVGASSASHKVLLREF